MTRSTARRLIKIALAGIFIVIIISYAISRSLSYARGPVITVNEPADGSGIASSTVSVIGRAERVNSLSLNGRPITIDQDGDFAEVMILFKGENTITLDAKDLFGRQTEKQLHVYGL